VVEPCGGRGIGAITDNGDVRALILLLAALALAACSSPPPAPDPGLGARLVGASSGDGAYTELERLQQIADAHGGNRALGTPGYEASVDHIATTLRAAGYTVDTPGFEVRAYTVGAEELTVGGEAVESHVMEFSPATPPGGITAPLHVLTALGCAAADFAGTPAGAVVLAQRGTCPFLEKSENAKRAGAAAVIIVNTDDTPLSATLGDATEILPTTSVSRSVGTALTARAGQPVALTLDTRITRTPSRNVIAQTTTGDPGHVVMAGAHLDSVRDGPGIDDNGSGSAALLEVALALGPQAAVANQVRFAWWGAEEVGLVGSSSYVSGLSPDAQRAIALYLNLDMVGSPNPGYFVYDGDSADAPAGSSTVEQVLREQLPGAADTPFDGRSDYGPFVAVGIPAGGLFSGAEELKTPAQAAEWGGEAGRPLDGCYHQACDTLANIDRVALDRNVDALAAALGRFAVDLSGIPAR
jgi:Zn-dependent M28 family amino/carboxypeptidase